VKLIRTFYALLLMLTGVLSLPALGQITPSDDAYTLTSSPTKNFGTATTLEVGSSGATTFVRFDLSGIPSSVTGSMVAKGTLKIFVGTVATAGSFNVDLVTSSWSEKTITANSEPTLGGAIASAIPVTTSDKDQYILVDVTAAVVDWLNGTANDGIALVPDGTVSFALNSKETTSTSHSAELDIVLTGPAGPQGPPGPISGVTAGPGLTGGGTKGNVTVSLLTNCASGQVLQWNGNTWACSSAGAGTITGVTAGTDLTGGGAGGNITLNLDTTKVPQLAAANTFATNQQINGSLTVAKGFSVTGDSFFGASDSGTALQVSQGGASGTGAILGVSKSNASGGYAILGTALGTSGAVFGTEGSTQSPIGAGVVGVGGTESVTGDNFGSSAGVWGDAGTTAKSAVVATADNAFGLLAYNNSLRETVLAANQTTLTGSVGNGGYAFGVIGSTQSPNGVGVAGQTLPVSGSYQDVHGSTAIGVSGDTGILGGIGVLATEDTGYALWAQNDSSYTTSIFLNDNTSTSVALYAGNLVNHCTIDNAGDLVCTGSMSGAVQSQGDHTVRLYAVQSPENWFEDFGSGKLSNGSATVSLDFGFSQTVNTSVDYHVFITPNGESEGLYVVNKTAGGFEVREQHSGHSNIGFDYRIVAHRKGSEGVRLEDITERQNLLAAQNRHHIVKSDNPAAQEQIQKRLYPRPHAALGTKIGQSGSSSKSTWKR
jgi:hypothetical protein